MGKKRNCLDYRERNADYIKVEVKSGRLYQGHSLMKLAATGCI